MIEYPTAALEMAKEITFEGTDEDRLAFYAFEPDDLTETIVLKFEFWARVMYPRYFTSPAAPFHRDMAEMMILAYCGKPLPGKKSNYLNLGFRGCAKTTYTKLFLTFAILNDRAESRKYIKVLTRNQGNSRQIVTDVYNLMLEVRELYGDYFLKDNKDKKQEETMGSFTTNDGRKLLSGTIGMTQRGHLQDASRPDFILFDDVEDRESIVSLPMTESTISRIDEALAGLSADGKWVCNGNYISDEGVIQWFINMDSVFVHKITIADEEGNPTWGERYDKKKIEELRLDALDFYGEYMCDPSRADTAFFDRARVDADMEKTEQPYLESAGVRYWGEYQPHHAYSIGGDVGEGIGRDHSAMGGWDFGQLDGGRSRFMIEYINNRIAPDLFGHEMMRVGREFGNCLLAPERNNVGHGTIAAMRGYPNIYTARDETNRKIKITEKFGWTTNRKTKPQMFFEFRKDYNDGLIEIPSLNLLKEMRAYTTMDLQDNRIGMITRHFDLLTAAVIGYQMKKHASLDNYGDDDWQEDAEPLYSDIFG
jgi:hypothetical protein